MFLSGCGREGGQRVNDYWNWGVVSRSGPENSGFGLRSSRMPRGAAGAPPCAGSPLELRSPNGVVSTHRRCHHTGRMAAPGPDVATHRRTDIVVVVTTSLLLLLPFLGKAFHMFDPIYLWVAEQIQHSPFDFYGFDVNWHGQPQPVAQLMQDPPGLSSYLAAASSLLGRGETAIHAAMILPTLALILGTYALSARWCSGPRLAALMLLAMPGFLVSATSVTPDVTMLALGCWALVAWRVGVERRSIGGLLVACLLATFCAMAKISGIAIVPLLAVYALLRERRWLWWIPFLVIPLAAIGAYQAHIGSHYGIQPIVGIAPGTATVPGDGLGAARNLLVGLSFLGGCLLTGLFYAPWLWSLRAGIVGAGLAILGTVALFGLEIPPSERNALDAAPQWLLSLQFGVFVACGAQWLAIAATDLYRRRDADSLVLVLWLAGTLLFASTLHSSMNASNMLPAAVPAAILLARRLEARDLPATARSAWLRLLPLAPAVAVALAVAAADHAHAGNAKFAAQELARRHAPHPGTLWFQGAWGFQDYAQRSGARKLDLSDSQLEAGDVLIIPVENTGIEMIPMGPVSLIERAAFPLGRRFETMSRSAGAGFYSSSWGPLPFAIATAEPDEYYVLRARRRLRIGSQPDTKPSDGEPTTEAELRAALKASPCLNSTWSKLADLRLRNGGPAAHVKILEEVLARCNAPPEFLNNLSYLLATADDPEIRDTSRAIDLAGRAIAAIGENPVILDTLAVAYGADGRFDEAIETSTRAIEAGERMQLPESVLGEFRRHRATLENHDPVRD